MEFVRVGDDFIPRAYIEEYLFKTDFSAYVHLCKPVMGMLIASTCILDTDAQKHRYKGIVFDNEYIN